MAKLIGISGSLRTGSCDSALLGAAAALGVCLSTPGNRIPGAAGSIARRRDDW